MEKFSEKLTERYLTKLISLETKKIFRKEFDNLFKEQIDKNHKEEILEDVSFWLEISVKKEIKIILEDKIDKINLFASASIDNEFIPIIKRLFEEYVDYLDYTWIIIDEVNSLLKDKKQELQVLGILDKEGNLIENNKKEI